MEEFRRFLAVANSLSISRAAEHLHVSQPALSRTIALLEERFRAPLFRRTAAGVELTESGIVLYEHASRAISALTNAEEEINHAQRQGRLSISIGAGDSWGYGILPTIIREFGIENPDISIRVDIVDHETRMDGLRNGTYEIAFGVASPKFETAATHVFTPLIKAPYDIYCAESHPLLRLDRWDQADLFAYPWINHKFEYDFDASQWQKTGRNYMMRTNTMLNTIEIVRGSPYLISTAKTFRDIFQRNGIVKLMEDPMSRIFVSGAIYLSRTPLRTAARKLLSKVTSYCDEHFGRLSAD